MSSDTPTSAAIGRRTFLKGTAGFAGVAVAGTSASAAAQSAFGGWFDNVSNYDGVVDETGNSEVTVTVGAKGNNGNFAFGPAAIRVDAATNVVWKWNGKGGSHNVVAEDGSFKSETTGEEGHTFPQTFDEKGITKYACSPHKAMGMKGVVVVGSEAAASAPEASGPAASGSEASGSAASGSGASGMDSGELLTVGVGGLLAAALLGLPVAEMWSRRKKSQR